MQDLLPVDNDAQYCREDALYVGAKLRNQINQLFFIRNGGVSSSFTKNRTPLSAATHKTPLLTATRVSSNRTQMWTLNHHEAKEMGAVGDLLFCKCTSIVV
jgi:hypothetical protein